MRSGFVTGTALALAVLLPLMSARAQSPTPEPGSLTPHHDAHGSDVPGLGIDEIEELRQGHGMGQARVAEVQGYPGPRHVLDAWHAGELALTSEQSAQVQAIMRVMTREAQRLGVLVLDAERGLADAFRSGRIDASTLRADLERITALRSELRLVHLQAHLETRAVLDPDQLARYADLRGHAPKGVAPRSGP
jgi:Spy/CpxP family protein refolding chaperone